MTRTVIYLRLSDEDRDKLTKEELSESIKNQEIMLKDYAKEQNWLVTDVYNDEDYSGADRDRPNFNRMIKECEKGNVDVVLVKTQARFARDIELIDKYVHNKFKEWNVRFFTLLEKIDNTRQETKKTSQITSMVDEWYVEDTSNNIRTTFRYKRQNGQFTGSFAPYGYKKDNFNKNHLVIDTIAAKVVKRIYNEYAKGYGIRKITKGLAKDNILSPLEYKLINNSKLKIPMINKRNYKYIDKAGSFIIKSHYMNNTKEVINNLISINIISASGLIFTPKLNLKIHKYNKDSTKIFYSTKKLEDLNIKVIDKKIEWENLNINNWQQIDDDGNIPSNVTNILTFTKKLNQLQEISYEIEVSLSENKKQELFYFYNFAQANNTKIVFDYQIRNKYNWSEQTIKKILKDEVYIGNLLQFKTTYVSYKNHKIIYNDKEDWIRYDNAHEAIIDKKLWNEVRTRLLSRKKAGRNGKAHILANKVFCASCHKVFCKCGKCDKNGSGYLCCKDRYTKWSNCHNKKYIKEQELHSFILKSFNDLLKKYYKEEVQLKINNHMIEEEIFKESIDALKKEDECIRKELDRKSSLLQGIYEDRKEYKLDDFEYMVLKSKYKDDWEKLNKRLLIITSELEEINEKKKRLNNRKELFKKYKRIDELNIEIVNEFIEKIEIDNYNEKINRRKIKIFWNFI